MHGPMNVEFLRNVGNYKSKGCHTPEDSLLTALCKHDIVRLQFSYFSNNQVACCVSCEEINCDVVESSEDWISSPAYTTRHFFATGSELQTYRTAESVNKQIPSHMFLYFYVSYTCPSFPTITRLYG